MSKDINLPQPRYLLLLKRMKGRISRGLKLEFWDDTTPGAKDTHNSWGLCSNDTEAYPDSEDHLWPEDRTRHAPKYRTKEQACPFDRGQDGSMGCFYRCMFFNPEGPKPNQHQALKLYEAQILKATT